MIPGAGRGNAKDEFGQAQNQEKETKGEIRTRSGSQGQGKDRGQYKDTK